MCALVQILDELDRRNLHGQEAHGARVYHLGLSDHLVSDTLAAVATRPRPASTPPERPRLIGPAHRAVGDLALRFLAASTTLFP